MYLAITLLTLPLIAEPQPGTKQTSCTRRGFPCKVTTGVEAVRTVHGLNHTIVNDEPVAPLNGSLFVAVACYDEDEFLRAWDEAMVPASRALARGVAECVPASFWIPNPPATRVEEVRSQNRPAASASSPPTRPSARTAPGGPASWRRSYTSTTRRSRRRARTGRTIRISGAISCCGCSVGH